MIAMSEQSLARWSILPRGNIQQRRQPEKPNLTVYE